MKYEKSFHLNVANAFKQKLNVATAGIPTLSMFSLVVISAIYVVVVVVVGAICN